MARRFSNRFIVGTTAEKSSFAPATYTDFYYWDTDLQTLARSDGTSWNDVASTAAPHAASHSNGGADEVSVLNLGGYTGATTNFLREDGTFAAPPGTGGGITNIADASDTNFVSLTTGDIPIYNTGTADWENKAQSELSVAWTQITSKPATFPPDPHNHAAADITSGELSASRLPYSTTSLRGAVTLAEDGGTTATTVVQATDARLSDARTPTAHNHSGADITSGTVGPTVGGTGKTTFTQHALLKGGASNAFDEIAPDTDGKVLKMVSGTPAWAEPAGGGGSSSPVEQAKTWVKLETEMYDMDSPNVNTVTVGTGAAIDTTNTNEAGHYGIWAFSTGSTSAGYASIGSAAISSGVFIAGEGEITLITIAKIGILSDATNRFITALGIVNYHEITTTFFDDGIYFRYSDNENSGNWQIICRASDTETNSDSGIAADTGWHVFKIVINAAGNSVSFYIDGTETSNSPISTNIPTGASPDLYPLFMIKKTAGTTARELYGDFLGVYQQLTTARFS